MDDSVFDVADYTIPTPPKPFYPDLSFIKKRDRSVEVFIVWTPDGVFYPIFRISTEFHAKDRKALWTALGFAGWRTPCSEDMRDPVLRAVDAGRPPECLEDKEDVVFSTTPFDTQDGLETAIRMLNTLRETLAAHNIRTVTHVHHDSDAMKGD